MQTCATRLGALIGLLALAACEKPQGRGKGLLARTYDQLAYQAESGPWRDVYRTGAQELRHGTRMRDMICRSKAAGCSWCPSSVCTTIPTRTSRS